MSRPITAKSLASNAHNYTIEKHYGPIQTHQAYAATMIRGQHYQYGLGYGPRYELHCDPRYMPSYAAMHAGNTTARCQRAIGPVEGQG